MSSETGSHLDECWTVIGLTRHGLSSDSIILIDMSSISTPFDLTQWVGHAHGLVTPPNENCQLDEYSESAGTKAIEQRIYAPYEDEGSNIIAAVAYLAA